MAQSQQQFTQCIEREIRLLIDEGVIRGAVVYAVEKSWRVLLDTDASRVMLIAEKSKKPRQFAKLDTAAAWLHGIGIRQFAVDSSHWGGVI